MTVIRLLIISNTRLYREALALSLGRDSDLSILAPAAGREQTLNPVSGDHPDVVLLDMAAPGSIATLRALLDTDPQLKVIALGVPESEQEVVALAERGVAGYLPAEGSLDDLLAAIGSAVRGEMLCSPRMAATLLKRVTALAAERQATWKPHLHLTSREMEIVRLIDRGLSNKEIASHLSIEVRTVKNHVHNILEKLQVHRRGEAAARWRAAEQSSRSVT